MDQKSNFRPNNKEYVILSLDKYKKMADICQTNVYWSADINEEIPIKYKLRSDKDEMPVLPQTIPQILYKNMLEYPDQPSFHSEISDEKWVTHSFKQSWDVSFVFAKALASIGVSQRAAVNIIGFNCAEWIWAFYGSIMADNIAVGVYATNTPEACQYIAEHSGAEVIVVENDTQLAKYLQIKHQLPKLKAIVNYGVESYQTKPSELVYSWSEFLDIGLCKDSENMGYYTKILQGRMENQVPGQCCNIVYTSGTTGNPKGVMLSHDNLIFDSCQLLRDWRRDGFVDGDARIVSYLPLCHVAAEVFDILSNAVARAQLFFARPDCLQGSLVHTMRYAKPTYFWGAPRIWEKFEEKIKEAGTKVPYLLKIVAKWARSKGYTMCESRIYSKPPPLGISMANWLALDAYKRFLGLEHAKVMLVTAAPLKKATFEFFKSLDLPIVNIYGMSECAGPETTQSVQAFREGTVGHGLEETSVKIDSRSQTDGGLKNEGEVCFRGRNNFVGYLNNEKATSETVDSEGYIHSGDVGTLNEHGYVKITGRIKEIIITAGGENVAPVPIEDSLKNICPIVNNVMVVGENKKFLVALITLKVDMKVINGKNVPTDVLTEQVKEFVMEELGVQGIETTEDAITNGTIMSYLDEKVKENNKICVSRAQQIRKYKVLADDFSMDGGELTPTLKLKRRVVLEKYKDIIDQIYNEPMPTRIAELQKPLLVRPPEDEVKPNMAKM